MKSHSRFWLSALVVIALTGCAAGGVDDRMASVPRDVVSVDGFPIYVQVVTVDEAKGIYDVEAGEGRGIAFTGINQPLVYQARFRNAAQIVLKQKFGEGSEVRLISESAPTGFIKLFMRYQVTRPS